MLTGIAAVAANRHPLGKFLSSLMVAMGTGLGWLNLDSRNFKEENTRLPNFITDTFPPHPDSHVQHRTIKIWEAVPTLRLILSTYVRCRES